MRIEHARIGYNDAAKIRGPIIGPSLVPDGIDRSCWRVWELPDEARMKVQWHGSDSAH